MPSLKGKLLPDVLSFLNLYGITPTILQSASATTIDSHNLTVLDQRPIAGTILFIEEKNPLIVQLQV